jgi:hypothetical protein
MEIEKGEDSAFILKAADRLIPLGGPVNSKTFEESPAFLFYEPTGCRALSCQDCF